MLIIQLLKETNTRCVKAKQSYQPPFVHKRKRVSSFGEMVWNYYRPDDCVVEMMTKGNSPYLVTLHTHTQSWRDIHRSFHTLLCDCGVVYTMDINNTPDDRHVMTAYCYSCLSSAFRFSPFMDISVHISLDQHTEMFLVNTEKWKKRFGMGFVLLGCSRTRTVQLLTHSPASQ